MKKLVEKISQMQLTLTKQVIGKFLALLSGVYALGYAFGSALAGSPFSTKSILVLLVGLLLSTVMWYVSEAE